MKILIAGLVKNIQVKRIREEGLKRGHLVDGCYAEDLAIYADSQNFKPRLFGKDITNYDLIYLLVSKRRWEWYTVVLYLRKKYNTIIVNKKNVEPTYPIFLTPASDYLRLCEKSLPFPKSAVIYSSKVFDLVESKFKYPLIIKPTSGRQGKDVYKVTDKNMLVKITNGILKKSIAVVVREFIPYDQDIRVFTVGYKAIGAMRRIPPKGDFRANISLGGVGENFDLSKSEGVRILAEKASRITKTEIAGVDIVLEKQTGKPYILEINPGPQFEGFEKYTNVNAAFEIIKYFEGLYNQRV